MNNFMRRIAVIVGAAVVSFGLIGATAVPAHADDETPPAARDSSWGR
jgi:hypothetical protein